jgi:DNA-binding transcriptional regulator YdaS (Cro superfamily)
MSSATVRLLEAAADMAGGEQRLAERLGIIPLLLRAYMEGRRALPDKLLLNVVDIVLKTMEPSPVRSFVEQPQLPSP